MQEKLPTQPPQLCRSLYVHVPFCLAKCRYCDFYSLPLSGASADAYVAAAVKELQANRAELTLPLETVFLGGGTPTAIGGQRLSALLEAIAPLAGPRAEFSVEANPGTIDPALAEGLARGGVNRLTLGVQSLQDDELKLLGRIHDAEQARQAVRAVRAAGIDNIGLDLIYGIPNQTPASWKASLEQALDMGIQHLSCYGLSFEHGTPLEADLAAGRVREMDEGLQKECYFAAIEAARGAGLEHYEISNFALPRRRCRHNLTYWHNQPYLGIGPGAASYLGGVRKTNRPDLRQYLDCILSGRPAPADSERITGLAAAAETIMLELRLREGVDRGSFIQRFGRDIRELFPQTTSRYQSQGALLITPSAVVISDSAIFTADTILADFISEADAERFY